MKKVLIVICAITLVCSSMFSLPAYGLDSEEIPTDLDVKIITNQIIELLNNSFNDEMPRLITEKDVDFSKAYKFYIETNIFKVESNNIDEVILELEKGDYIFEVPIFFENGDTCILNLQRALPLDEKAKEVMTDEMISEYKENEWCISAISFYLKAEQPFVDYYEMAGQADAEEKPIFIGGLPFFNAPIAIYADTSKNISKVVPLIPDAVEWDVLDIPIQSSFDYAKVKELVNSIEYVPNNLIGGGVGGNDIFVDDIANIPAQLFFQLMAIVIILAIVILATIIIKKRKNKSE